MRYAAMVSVMTFDDLVEHCERYLAQAKRLGHRIPGVRGIYSHVTPAMQQRITQALQHRWEATHPQHPASAVRRLRITVTFPVS